jgi:hypothetical protein
LHPKAGLICSHLSIYRLPVRPKINYNFGFTTYGSSTSIFQFNTKTTRQNLLAQKIGIGPSKQILDSIPFFISLRMKGCASTEALNGNFPPLPIRA